MSVLEYRLRKDMRVLIADDSNVTRVMLERTLTRLGYETVVTSDGAQAWQALQETDAPRLALLDRMMPEMDGLEVCRKMREMPRTRDVYAIIVTSKGEPRDIVEGLEQGADDYIIKPYDSHELAARIRVGVRIVEMQTRLTEKVEELERALFLVKRLQGVIPICSYCKSVRTDDEFWQSVDQFVSENSEAHFSHSICPNCYGAIVKPMMETYKKDSANCAEDTGD